MDTQTLEKHGPSKGHRWQKGETGNSKGRPEVPEIEELRRAIRVAKRKNGNKNILVHFVERAYVSDTVLIALIKKLVPDKVALNETFEEVRRIIIERPSLEVKEVSGQVRVQPDEVSRNVEFLGDREIALFDTSSIKVLRADT